MRLAPACVVAVAVVSAAITAPRAVDAQSLPSVLKRSSPQRAADQPPVPTVMRPAQGEVVMGDLVIAVQVPPNVPAREYTLEAAYWDPGRNDWVYPGGLGDNFSGGTTATTRIPAEVRARLNQKATRWKIHARVTQPPGSWGEWREFIWQPAPAPERAASTPAPSAAPTPVAAPTTTATGVGETAKPGIMVPGTTTPPGQQPPAGQPDTRTAPPPATPPSTNVPAVQQPPAPTLPNPVRPEPRTAPPPAAPPSTNVPAVQQPPAPTVPAVQQPPTPTVPAVQQPPAPTVPAVQKPPVISLPQVPRQLPGIPNLPMRLPTSLPKIRSGGTPQQPAEARPTQPQAAQPQRERETRLVSMTKLAVWDGKPMPAAHLRVYVRGPVDVDWAKKSLVWWFRGLTTAPGAVPGKWRWEMSRGPFASYGPWQPTPGIGYAGTADGVQFSLNLDPYAPRPAGWIPPGTASATGPVAVGQPALGVPAGRGEAPPTFSQRPGIPADLLGTPPAKRGQLTPAQVPLTAIQISLSLFVRVVPLDAAGMDADLPSNSVELVFGPAEKPTPFDPNPKHWPVVSYVSYRPVQGYTFDWQCWVKAATDITAPVFWDAGIDTGTKDVKTVLYKKGTVRNVCGSDDSSIVEDFVDAVGGFIEMMGKIVDWVSKTYSDLKAKVASTIASAIPGCASSPACQGAVQMGLNAGLAALGMPPDMPDFDQLQAMGEGYLVDAIAQQVAAKTGVPFADEAAKAALKEFIAKGKEAAQGGNGGGGAWIPDDSKQYKPLLLTLAVSNPSTTGATPAMYLEVSEPGGKRYLPRTVAVPSLAPLQSVNVSVALDPVNDPKAWMELLPTDIEMAQVMLEAADIKQKVDKAGAALTSWRGTYLTGSVDLQAALKQPPFVYKVVYKTQCYADKPWCVVQAPGGVPLPSPGY